MSAKFDQANVDCAEAHQTQCAGWGSFQKLELSAEKTWQSAPELASTQLLKTGRKGNSVGNSYDGIQEGQFFSSLERFKETA